MHQNPSERNDNKLRIRYSFLKILTGSDLSRRRLPLMSAVSGKPGPVVWLTACGHGDEVAGIVIIQEVFKNIRRQLLCGAVHAFPMMNPLGFESLSRMITVSREDLNRSFPGNPRGTLGERIADIIFNTIIETSPALVVDLHNDWIESIPYALIDRHPGAKHNPAYKKAIDLATTAGFCTIVDADELKTSLSYNLLLKDVPAITLEMGEPYVINEHHVQSGLGAICNILARLEMITPPKQPFSYDLPPEYGVGKILQYSERPCSSKSGIVRFLAKSGDIIRAGQPFARIVNVFGKHQETIAALDDAIILGHSDYAVVFPGMPIMAFGVARP